MKAKKVGIYVRVSTSEQSCDLQISELTTHADSRGWEIYRIYEDKRTGTNDKRSGLQDCLKDAHERKLDIVLVWKLDRFARSLKDLLNHLQTFQELGTEFVSLKDSFDCTTATGKLMLHLVGAFSEFEASLIRSRCKAGVENAKKKGIRFGRKPTIDTLRVEHLRRQGWSLSRIAKEVGSTKSGVSKVLARLSLTKGVTNIDITRTE